MIRQRSRSGQNEPENNNLRQPANTGPTRPEATNRLPMEAYDPSQDADVEKFINDTGVVQRSTLSPKYVSPQQATEVVKKVADFKGVKFETAYIGIGELGRYGAANAGAPLTMSVPLLTADEQRTVYMTKGEVIAALENVTGHKSSRNLFEIMAGKLLYINLQKHERNPNLELKGDLANALNRRLISKGHVPLSKKEEICASTFTQNLPNLNELAESNRLKALLDEDLQIRIETKKKKSQEIQQKRKRNTQPVTKGPSRKGGRKPKKQ